MIYHNVIIGKPLIEPWKLISQNRTKWETSDEKDTLFTDERFLPAILVEAGIVPSKNEVRRNRPDLVKTLQQTDCIWVKWGKKRIYIVVGK